MNRSPPFDPGKHVTQTIRSSITDMVSERQRDLTKSVLAPENILRYSHGSSWTHSTKSGEKHGAMETHSAEVSIPFDRILNGDLDLATECVNHITTQFQQQLMQSMYSLISRTCDETGNTVSAKEVGFPEAFLEMLEKIEFDVDAAGNVSLPQLHTGNAAKLLATLEAQPQDYQDRVEALIARKSADALSREAHRKSKFTKLS